MRFFVDKHTNTHIFRDIADKLFVMSNTQNIAQNISIAPSHSNYKLKKKKTGQIVHICGAQTAAVFIVNRL